MPAITALLTPEGLLDAPFTAASLDDAARQEPEGIYDVTRTYPGGRALLLDAHFDRLEKSARLEAIPLQLDRQRVRDSVRTLLARSGYPEARLRFAVPRDQPEHLYLTLTPFADFGQSLDRHRTTGVSVATLRVDRRNPYAKTNAWVHQRKAARADLPAGVYEGLIVNQDGDLLECFSSNFFAVKDGRLRTAGQGVLLGVARRVLLEVAPEVLPVELEPLSQDEIPQLQEALLTSSGRGVVPIVRIDQHTIASGQPGELTLALTSRYNAWVQARVEPI